MRNQWNLVASKKENHTANAKFMSELRRTTSPGERSRNTNWAGFSIGIRIGMERMCTALEDESAEPEVRVGSALSDRSNYKDRVQVRRMSLISQHGFRDLI